MILPIVPVPCFRGPAVSLSVDAGIVNLGLGAAFPTALLNAEGDVVAQTGTVALTPEQYAAWGSDDTQVAAALAANLGLTPA